MSDQQQKQKKRKKIEEEEEKMPEIVEPIPAFLCKLYEIMSERSLARIVSWDDSGTSFVVRDHNEFCSKVLPKYFKHNNFSSFVRQLNMYGFRKKGKGGSEEVFHHSQFRKGAKNLLLEIKRNSSSSGSGQSRKPATDDPQISEVMRRHEELEKRVKVLETANKEYAERLRLVAGECMQLNEKSNNLSKLVTCLTSIFAFQGSGLRELQGAPNSDGSFKKESILMIRNVLLDSLNTLRMQLEPQTLRYKAPMIEPAYDHSEDREEQRDHKPRLSIDFEENGGRGGNELGNYGMSAERPIASPIPRYMSPYYLPPSAAEHFPADTPNYLQHIEYTPRSALASPNPFMDANAGNESPNPSLMYSSAFRPESEKKKL